MTLLREKIDENTALGDEKNKLIFDVQELRAKVDK